MSHDFLLFSDDVDGMTGTKDVGEPQPPPHGPSEETTHCLLNQS